MFSSSFSVKASERFVIIRKIFKKKQVISFAKHIFQASKFKENAA